MDEVVPVILAAILGAVIWLRTAGRTRLVLSVVAVAVSGLVATVVSGEYLESWIYLFLDSAEAALGLVIGYVVAAWVLTPRTGSARTKLGGDTM